MLNLPKSDEYEDDPVLDAASLWQKQGLARADLLLTAASLDRAAKLVNAKGEALLRPYKITLIRFRVLSRLYWTDTGSLTLGEIASVLLVHPTSITSAIDRLERDGLVDRVPHPSDRRAMLAHITRTGRALVKRATRDLIAAEYGLAGVDAGIITELTLMLRHIRAVAGETVGSEDVYLGLLEGRPIREVAN